MTPFILKPFDIYIVDLPIQIVSKRENGQTFTVTGTEIYGDHRCIVVFADQNNQFAIVTPTTSAQSSSGAGEVG